MAVTVRGMVGFVVLGLVLGLIAAFFGLFRSHRTAVYVVVGVTVFVSVFVVRFRQELKKAKERPVVAPPSSIAPTRRMDGRE